MPSNTFTNTLSGDPLMVELADDDKAWSEAVVLSGQLLKELGRALPSRTEWVLDVREGERLQPSISRPSGRSRGILARADQPELVRSSGVSEQAPHMATVLLICAASQDPADPLDGGAFLNHT